MDDELKSIMAELPTLGSVRERLSYFACTTEAGELNTTLNRAMNYVHDLEKELVKWQSIAKMFYDRHENRRSCSLLASCKQCDAYEEAIKNES